MTDFESGPLRVAEKARAALGLAGFPAHIAVPLEERPGFEIEVDGEGEEAQVFINWRTSEKLLDAAMQAYHQERTDDPSRLLYEAVQLRMREVAIEILGSAGFQAVEAEGYRSLDVEIKGVREVLDLSMES